MPQNHEGNAGIHGLVPPGCLHPAVRDCCSWIPMIWWHHENEIRVKGDIYEDSLILNKKGLELSSEFSYASIISVNIIEK